MTKRNGNPAKVTVFDTETEAGRVLIDEYFRIGRHMYPDEDCVYELPPVPVAVIEAATRTLAASPALGAPYGVPATDLEQECPADCDGCGCGYPNAHPPCDHCVSHWGTPDRPPFDQWAVGVDLARKCTCGADKCGMPRHADYCDKEKA